MWLSTKDQSLPHSRYPRKSNTADTLLCCDFFALGDVVIRARSSQRRRQCTSATIKRL